MSKDCISQFKQQLTLELQPFIGMSNNKKTQHQMLITIQDLIDRFNAEGYNITINPELMSELNDIRLTFSDYEKDTAEENN